MTFFALIMRWKVLTRTIYLLNLIYFNKMHIFCLWCKDMLFLRYKHCLYINDIYKFCYCCWIFIVYFGYIIFLHRPTAYPLYKVMIFMLQRTLIFFSSSAVANFGKGSWYLSSNSWPFSGYGWKRENLSEKDQVSGSGWSWSNVGHGFWTTDSSNCWRNGDASTRVKANFAL